MGKIRDIFFKAIYNLPFGMRGADKEILGSTKNVVCDESIVQEVSDERVAKHLLKGEVTQGVEELRYRTYKVDNEAKGYEYLGNGVAVKKDEQTSFKTKHKFTQENKNLCAGLNSALKETTDGNYEETIDRYTIELNYNHVCRFRIDKRITNVDVLIDDKKGIIETTLHFNSEPDIYDGTSMPFINELKKLLSANEEEIKRNEIATAIRDLSFCTYKADNEEDFVTYSFSGEMKYEGLRKVGYEYLMKLSWEEYVRLPLNLEAKYYSKSMAEKYEKKERKDVVIPMVNIERKRYCSVCGREMNNYDADIQEVDGSEPICTKCLESALKK